MPRYISTKQLTAASKSSIVYVRLRSQDMAMFRFLMEAHDALAMLTIIEPKATLVKILYSPHEEERLHLALTSVQELISVEIVENPFL